MIYRDPNGSLYVVTNITTSTIVTMAYTQLVKIFIIREGSTPGTIHNTNSIELASIDNQLVTIYPGVAWSNGGILDFGFASAPPFPLGLVVIPGAGSIITLLHT